MIGKCALLDIETELKNSHIIPKFAFDYLKETGGKYLRTYENPNQRKQDGPKKYLLSEKAEMDFSKRERWFMNSVFLPYMRDEKKSFNYKEEFAFFAISVLWRVLLDQMDHPDVKRDERLSFLHDVEKEWKAFLSKGIYPQLYNDINIFLTDRVSTHNTTGINVDLYMTRIIDATIITNENGSTVAIYVKFLRFIFWSIVKGKTKESKDVKIRFDKGNLSVPQKVKDDFLGGFINNRIKEIDERPGLSEAQKKIIINEVYKNEDDFWKTDGGKAMINDYQLKNQNLANR